jgi:DNA topoisomerase IA
MARLLVVESPNNVKKMQGYLDGFWPGQFRVVATVGHWRGLPPMNGQAFADTVNVTQ